MVESSNHQGIYYFNRGFLRHTRPDGSDVPQVIAWGAVCVLHVPNHGHFGIKRNVDVVNTGTGDDVTAVDLPQSAVVFLLIVARRLDERNPFVIVNFE